MGATPSAELERDFAPSLRGTFMVRQGGAGRSRARSNKKICFVATDKAFLVSLLHDLSMRDDCCVVKYSVEPRDGMYLGRCFLTSDSAAGRLCQAYKSHPKLMVTIQDDEFFAPYRTTTRNG